jgi:dynein intermediate chain 2
MNSKTGTEFFTTSTDGQVMWWDSRKMSEPTEVLRLEINGRSYGGITADFESTVPTRFMIGTEQGTIINGNRKGKTDADKLNTYYEGHHGPVYAVKRNPFFPKYFLSIGDWTARVWCDDVKESAVLWSKYYPCYTTCASWSPSRPAVAFTGKSDGTVDVYDYLFKSNEPALTLQVGDAAVRSVMPTEFSPLLACGCYDGSVTLFELSDSLVTMQGANEKAAMAAMLERETSREKLLASRMRELALQQRIKSGRPPRPSGSAALERGGGGDDEEDPVKAAEKNFWSMVDPEYYERINATAGTDGDAPAENGSA